MPLVDVTSNRSSRKWSHRELLGRFAWTLAGPLFLWSPRPFWIWRRFLLRMFGAHVGRDVRIHPTVSIEIPWNLRIGEQTGIGDRVILYALGTITIGARVTVSQGAHLCAGTHDWRRADMPLLKSSIRIEDEVWVCADAFLGPGITVGEAAIVGARAVVMRDVPSGIIVAGNPAMRIGARDD